MIDPCGVPDALRSAGRRAGPALLRSTDAEGVPFLSRTLQRVGGETLNPEIPATHPSLRVQQNGDFAFDLNGDG